MPLPPSRKPGNHSTRWRTTSRAVHASTGEGASHSLVPRVSSVNRPATARCRAGGSCGMPVTARPLSSIRSSARVAVVHAGLHAAGQPAVARLEGVAQAHRVQPGAPVAEVLEDQRLEGHALGHALPGEGLHDPVRADGVEAAPEGGLELRPAGRGVAPRPSVAGVPVLDLGADVVGADPAGEQLGVGVGPEQLRRGGREVAVDVDHRDLLVGLDPGLGARGGHDACPSVCGFCFRGVVLVVLVVLRQRVAVLVESGEHRVEAREALLGPALVPLDPLGHEVEHLRFQVHRAALCLPAAADQAGVLEHLEVLGDGLEGHLVGRRDRVDRGVAHRQPGDDVAPGRVGECREHLRQLVAHAVLLDQPNG